VNFEGSSPLRTVAWISIKNSSSIEYVEQQRDLERYRARREQMLDQAGILSRWKWKITGVPVEDGDEQ
jgi:hypothetical protein